MCYFSLTKQPFIKFKIGIPSRTQPDLMRLSQPSLGEPCKWYPLSGLGLAVILLLFICPIQWLIFSLTKVACYFFSKYVLHPFSTKLQSIMIIINFVINIIHIFFISSWDSVFFQDQRPIWTSGNMSGVNTQKKLIGLLDRSLFLSTQKPWLYQ